jgi:hypothetical protein
LKAGVVPVFSPVIWFVAKVRVTDPEPPEPLAPFEEPQAATAAMTARAAAAASATRGLAIRRLSIAISSLPR